MIIQQPYEQSLGFSLINNLTSNDFSAASVHIDVLI